MNFNKITEQASNYNHLEKSFFRAVDLVTSSQSQDQLGGRLKDILKKLQKYTYYVDELEIYYDDNLG